MKRRSPTGLLAAAAGTVFALLAWFVMAISPDPEERPLVTVYMQSDCATCRAWIQYLNQNGFRAAPGEDSEWQRVRARVPLPLPPSSRAPHTALVEGHKVLQSRSASGVKGLVVAGTPAGAPGVNAALPEPYIVFLVHDAPDGGSRSLPCSELLMYKPMGRQV
jgi:hypothetical protein